MSKERKIVETNESVYFFGCEFSNFHYANFELNGVNFFCSEQAFMYCKARLFNDDVIAEQILNAKSPVECKRLGRKVKNFDGALWNEKKEKYMLSILKAKFTQNKNLKTLLLNTGEKMIYEASPYDKEWGIGIGVDDAVNGKAVNGLNKLGKALVEVRTYLKSN